jgi:protein subunit release factor A
MRTLLLSLLLATTTVTNGNFPYLFQRANGSTSMRMNGRLDDSLAHAKNLRSRFKGGFIWARKDGRQYVIQDPAILAEAEKIFAQLERVAENLKPYQAQIRAIEAGGGDEEAMEAELEKVERAMERIENELEKLEAPAERRFEQLVIRAIETGKAKRY